MKYLLLLAVVAGLAWWWWERRKAVVRARMAEREPPKALPLVACPKCGVYAPEGQHRCG